MAMASSLPAELIEEEILMRLPVESMVRFRSVCKLWNSLFYDPKFIQNHFNRSSSSSSSSSYISPKEDNDDYLLLWEHADVRPRSLTILSQYKFFETTINKPSYSFRQFEDSITLVGSMNGLVFEHNMTLVGSMNGLVCIADFKYHNFILWNPAIHWIKKILPPRNRRMPYMVGFSWDAVIHWLKKILPATNRKMPYMVGFGWDSSTNDYKLVAKHSASKTAAFVYSCKTDNWSEQKVTDFRVTDYQQFPCVMVKGIPYWRSTTKSTNRVIKFDVTNNEFNFLDIPFFGKWTLINWNDCLASVRYYYRHVRVYRFGEQNGYWSWIYQIDTTNPASMFFKNDVGETVLNGINSYTPTMLALKGMKPIRSSQKLDDGLASYFDDDCLVETE